MGGGALFLNKATEADINSTLFSNNIQVAGNNGAALWAMDSGLTMAYTTFVNNTITNGAGSGGQLFVYNEYDEGKPMSVSHCSFSGENNLTGTGGTIFFHGRG